MGVTIIQLLPHINRKQNNGWIKTISGWQSESMERDIINIQTDKLYGAQVIRDIWKETNGDALIVTDVGQHQMFTWLLLLPLR